MNPPETTGAFEWLDARAAVRRKVGLSRSLRARSVENDLIDVAGNDYLGLSRHVAVREAAADAALKWGAGATGSRLVSGTTDLHVELESELAEFFGSEAALVFSSGYTANLGAVSALCGPDTLIVGDRHNHASLIDASRLSSGDSEVAPHNNPVAVERILSDRSRARALVVTESIFSVDGDLAPLSQLTRVCKQHRAGLIIDDAHGFCVVGPGGRGAVAEAGLAGDTDVVTTITLSKALGSQGGAVLGSRSVIQHLIDSARSFLFDTGLAPAAVGGALGALRLVQQEPERVVRVQQVARRLYEELTKAGLTTREPAGAVVSIDAPSPEFAVAWATACREQGVAVGCFRPPSVPDRISRLRLTARADLTDAEIDRVIDVVTQFG